MTTPVIETARSYLAAGLSVIPVRADGSKAPVEPKWDRYAEMIAGERELQRWFGGGKLLGIGIAGGKASGNLAVLDFETTDAYIDWRRIVPADTTDALSECPVVKTPSGGYHVWVRLTECTAGTVLARRVDPDNPARGKVLIEIRGDGQQVLAPGCPAECHKTGKLYEFVDRGWLDGTSTPVPIGVFVNWMEAAASLNQWTPAKPQREPKQTQRDREPSHEDPGTDFNRRGTWAEAGLFDAGWTWAREMDGDRGTVKRPGKDAEGISGTLGIVSSRANHWPFFYSFSTNCPPPLQPNTPYDRFGMFIRLKHMGDVQAATKALLDKGYGVRKGRKGRAESPRKPPPAPPGTVEGEIDFPPPVRGEQWNDPHRLARLFAAEAVTSAGESTLVQWRGEFHRWTGGAWLPIADADLDSDLARFCREVFEVDLPKRVVEAEQAAEAEGGKPTKPKLYAVTGAVKANARLNLAGLLNHSDNGTDPPFWLPGPAGPDAATLISAPNGLFTLEGIAGGRGPIAAPTPRLFTPFAIPFDIPAAAAEPALWLKCLAEWFDKDAETIDGLQEWFGYLLSGRTHLHKILLLVGPPRSGKGTILNVLTDLLGPGNVASTTFAALGDNFGLENLLRKSTAVVPDARLSGRTDTAAIVERLLSISGEDLQSVNRKNRDRITARLPVRFVLATNEVPRLPDASGAIESRFHILHAQRSWLHQEDLGLRDRLRAELPGILLWAARGWVKLQSQRFRFTQNARAENHRRELADLSSPIKAFIRQCCTIGPEEKVEIPTLFESWRRWNEQHKREIGKGGEGVFGRDMRAALPQLRVENRRGAIGRTRVYCGVGLKSEQEWGDDETEPAE